MEFAHLRPILKNHLKAKKLTYRDLGKKIGMSESAVKKLLTGGDCSLNRLSQICEAIGVPVLQMLSMAEDPAVHKITMTNEVQQFFLHNPDHFGFYWLLVYEAQPVEAIQKKFSLSDRRIDEFLIALQKLDLIRVEPPRIIHVPLKDIVLWGDNGPLVSHLKREWATRILEQVLQEIPSEQKSLFALRSFLLLPETCEEFRKDLQELLLQYHKRSANEMLTASNRTRSIRFMAAVAPGGFVDRVR